MCELCTHLSRWQSSDTLEPWARAFNTADGLALPRLDYEQCVICALCSRAAGLPLGGVRGDDAVAARRSDSVTTVAGSHDNRFTTVTFSQINNINGSFDSANIEFAQNKNKCFK